MTDLVITSVVAALVLVVRLGSTVRPRSVAKGVETWSQQFGLTVTDDVRPFLLRRRRATSIGFAVGMAVGIEAAAWVPAVVPGTGWSLLGGFATQAAWLLTGGVGVLVGGAVAANLVPASGPRFARERAVGLADYVPAVERGLPPVVAVTVGAVGLVPYLRGADGAAALTAAAAGLAGLLVVGVAEVAARVVVTRPQRADSPHLLAWTDALRSEHARTLLAAGTAIAAGTLSVSVPQALIALGAGPLPRETQSWVLLVLAALIGVLAIRSMVSGSARYFLRRLWPEVAAELDGPTRALEEAPR